MTSEDKQKYKAYLEEKIENCLEKNMLSERLVLIQAYSKFIEIDSKSIGQLTHPNK
jgi:hypothetical protein